MSFVRVFNLDEDVPLGLIILYLYMVIIICWRLRNAIISLLASTQFAVETRFVFSRTINVTFFRFDGRFHHRCVYIARMKPDDRVLIDWLR